MAPDTGGTSAAARSMYVRLNRSYNSLMLNGPESVSVSIKKSIMIIHLMSPIQTQDTVHLHCLTADVDDIPTEYFETKQQ